MSERFSFDDINRLLIHLGIETQELSQKKNELKEQINVCRATIAEKTLYIETTKKDIKKLNEDISVKQKTYNHNKINVERLRAANSLLLQYEQTLKIELESRTASFSKEKEVYEDRIASCRAKFQSHKEYYLQNPLAQKLLMVQAEIEDIQRRLNICDDQITLKQTELDHLTAPEVASCSNENLPESVVVQQQHTTEQEKKFDGQEKMDSDTSIDLTTLQLHKTRENPEEICDESPVQDIHTCDASSQKFGEEPWSSPQSHEQSQSAERSFEDQDQITSHLDDNLSTVPNDQEAVEAERGAANEEHSKRPAACPSTPSRENVHSFFAMTPGSSISTSPLNLNSSPSQGTSETKSPYFLFSANSNPSTPGFAGFGFEPDSSQEEESPFGFTGSLFNEKKTPESKSPGGPEFLFGQSEQSEHFQFSFSETPQSANKGESAPDFPFSFNF